MPTDVVLLKKDKTNIFDDQATRLKLGKSKNDDQDDDGYEKIQTQNIQKSIPKKKKLEKNFVCAARQLGHYMMGE